MSFASRQGSQDRPSSHDSKKSPIIDAMHAVITTEGLQALLDALRHHGYRVVGPIVRDQAIVYDDIASIADLPRGWTDAQDGGHYRLTRRDDDALFGYAVGPHSWKKFLHPPVLRLWHAAHDGDGMRVVSECDTAERFAFIGDLRFDPDGRKMPFRLPLFRESISPSDAGRTDDEILHGFLVDQLSEFAVGDGLHVVRSDQEVANQQHREQHGDEIQQIEFVLALKRRFRRLSHAVFLTIDSSGT